MAAHRLGFVFGVALGVAVGQQPEVTVRIFNYAGVPDNTLQKAKQEAERVLRRAAVVARWLDCPLRDGEAAPRYTACLVRTDPADVILRIIPRFMEDQRNVGDSLGYAMPFTGERPPTRAYVRYEHLRERVRKCERFSEGPLLGYVMAHEVAHLLFGDERHSRSGIMMASWLERESIEIERGTLDFSADEAHRLRAGATARMHVGGQR